jgi:hypothetical protein
MWYCLQTTSIITASTKDALIERLNLILIRISKWVQAKNLVLNPMKTKVLKFAPSKLSSALNFTYAGQYKPEVATTKFLGLQHWQSNFLEVSFSLFTHRSSCFIMRCLNRLLTIDSPKLMYFVHFQSIIKYGAIFGG